jgi:anti-anti-sigma factor
MRSVQEIDVLIEEIADGVVLRPIGMIDYSGAPILWRRLDDVQQRAPDRLIIDLAEVPSIDSSVIATLVQSMQQALRTSRMLILCGLQDPVRALFEIVRLDQSVFTIVENIDEAVALPNRRKFGRFNLEHLKCDIGRIMDISAGGLRVRTDRKPRGRVKLRLWDDRIDVVVEAEVAWSRRIRLRRHESGLRFVNIGTEASKRLATIVSRAADRTARARNRAPDG